MPKDTQHSNRPTLENLLELKRCERPSEAFWNHWDARLREKQLAALIPVASPWSRLATVLGRFAKVGVPVTAAAAVAIGIVVLNKDQLQTQGVIARSSSDGGVVTAATGPANAHDHSFHEGADGIKAVVIEAAPEVVAVASNADSRTSGPSAGQLARTLPWLTNVSASRETVRMDIEAATSLRVDSTPTPLAVTAFEESRRESRPVWVPTEQHLREAVASEIGIGSAVADRTQTGWMARVIAANPRSRYMESRIESEDYPRELSRVGVTASTLSFKF